MYLLNDAALPMTTKKTLLFEGLMGEESTQAMGSLLLALVFLLHVEAFFLIKNLVPADTVKPAIIMEVSMVAIPLPVADVPAPLPEPPKPVPPPPKPVVKPKPVKKPVVKKPVVHKTEPIYIPVAEKPSPLPVTAPAPAPVKAAPAAGKPEPAKQTFSEAKVGANYGYNPKPKYPSIARSRGWTGKVILQVHVSANGEADGVSVSQSSGHEVLDDAAVAAVEGWRFVPAKRGDTAVASTVHVPINFKLDN